MSLSSLADRDVERYQSRVRTIHPEIDDADQTPLAAAAKAIVTHIPAEVVTVYVALTALVNESAEPIGTAHWTLMWVVLALTPIVIWLLFAVKARKAGLALPAHPRHWPWVSMVISMLAFVVWAFSLPKSPFETLSWYRPVWGAGVLLIGTLLLGLIAELLHKER